MTGGTEDRIYCSTFILLEASTKCREHVFAHDVCFVLTMRRVTSLWITCYECGLAEKLILFPYWWEFNVLVSDVDFSSLGKFYELGIWLEMNVEDGKVEGGTTPGICYTKLGSWKNGLDLWVRYLFDFCWFL